MGWRQRGRSRGRSECRGRNPGPGPLDVGDGGAHEPRDTRPPPGLHVERGRGNQTKKHAH